jgi:hypothetical protein
LLVYNHISSMTSNSSVQMNNAKVSRYLHLPSLQDFIISSHSPNSTHLLTQSSFLDSPTIEIRVGGEAGRSFFIHQDLLTSHSLFFANALNTKVPFRDDDDSDTESIDIIPHQEADHGIIPVPEEEPDNYKRIIDLPMHEPDIFAAWVQLIYHNTLPPDTDPPKPTLPPKASKAAKTQAAEEYNKAVRDSVRDLHLVFSKLYILCTKLQDLEAKKAVFTTIMDSTVRVRTDGFSYSVGLGSITLIYAGTVAHDPLRTFLVDCYVFRGGVAWGGDQADLLPVEFLFDVMKGMLRERERPVDTGRTRDAKRYLDGMTLVGETGS